MELIFTTHFPNLSKKKLNIDIVFFTAFYGGGTRCKRAPAWGDKNALFRIIDSMLTKSKFKDFFQKNVASL